jgi:hypothetical protein
VHVRTLAATAIYPKFGCVLLYLGNAWTFDHQSAKPGISNTVSLSANLHHFAWRSDYSSLFHTPIAA